MHWSDVSQYPLQKNVRLQYLKTVVHSVYATIRPVCKAAIYDIINIQMKKIIFTSLIHRRTSQSEQKDVI